MNELQRSPAALAAMRVIEAEAKKNGHSLRQWKRDDVGYWRTSCKNRLCYAFACEINLGCWQLDYSVTGLTWIFLLLTYWHHRECHRVWYAFTISCTLAGHQRFPLKRRCFSGFL